MKIRMSKSFSVYQVYDTIEINKEDYPELKDLTDEDDLVSEFQFNRDLIKDKFLNEEFAIHLIKED